MGVYGWQVRWVLVFCLSARAVGLASTDAQAQSALKKVRLGIAATSVGFLPIYAAYHRGFYKDEGIDLEIVLMSLAAATTRSSRERSSTAPASPVWRLRR